MGNRFGKRRTPSGGEITQATGSPRRALALATVSFALSFAAWGLIGGLASVFAGIHQLSASQTALLVAVPVLLGSLAIADGPTVNGTMDCEAREDWRIIQDIAQALGRPHGFTFSDPREIFEELRIASKGGVADYSGVTYEKITEQLGVFWPCYSHEGRFDLRTGEPTAGPPRRPLSRIVLEIRGRDIYAVGVEERT
jgi:hypothetical protein